MREALVLVLLVGIGSAWGQTETGPTFSSVTTSTSSIVLSSGPRPILTCLTGIYPETKGCKIGDGYTLDDVVTAMEKEINAMQTEQRRMVHYDDVCAKWGRWHYRKGSETHDGNGYRTYIAPDRYRVCVAPKPIY
jgi:hypothetical protein